MTIETRPGRPPAAPQTTAPAPLVVPPRIADPGPDPVRRTAPPRGAGQADRSGPVRRRPRLPRRLVSARRSAPPSRRRGCSRSTSTRASTGRRWPSSRPPTSPATTSWRASARTSRSSSRSAARSATRRSRSPCSRRRIDRRSARRAVACACGPSRCEPVFDPSPRRSCSPTSSWPRATWQPGLAEAEVVVEGTYRVGHQEQLYIENNAMIALPREDGGVTVHGSLQCPYYVHKALKRGLGLSADQAQVVQAETGGGFGGKEEYPSMIGLHAALLARRTGRPVRMIYDRHEDLAATTKRHPAIVTHRTGVMRDGRIVAQDIELVLDGGAYTTLTPVVLSRATIHAAGPYDVPNVRIRSRAVMTNTPPNGAFRGFGAPAVRVRRRDPAEPGRRGDRDVAARDPAPQRLPARAGSRRRSRSCAAALPAKEVLERAAEASEFERVRARTASARDARTARERTARGIGLALAWHGAGFTGSGEAKMGSLVSLELTGEGAVRILTRVDRDGPGHEDDLPPARRRRARPGRSTRSRSPRRTRRSCPTPARRWRRGRRWSSAACSSRPPAGSARRSRSGPAGRSPSSYATTPGATAPPGSTSPSSPTRASASTTRRTPATPIRRSAGRPPWPRSRSISTRARWPSCRSSRSTTWVGSSTRCCARARSKAGRSRPSATRRSRRSSCATAATSTTGSRPTSSRPRSTRPGSRRSSSRRRFDDAPHGAKGVGELPMDVGAPAVVAAIHDATGAWIHDLPATPERILAALARDRPRRDRPGSRPGPTRRPPGERSGAMTYQLTVNGQRVRGRRARDAPAARRPARGPRA